MKSIMKPLSLVDILVRFLSGLAAGIAGSVMLVIVVFLSWSAVGDTLSTAGVTTNEFGVEVIGEGAHPLFAYFVVLAVFLAILVANVSYVLISTVVSEHYDYRTTLVTDVFFGNLVLLVLMIPVYIMINANFGYELMGLAAFIHLVLAAIMSFFILELINWSKYLLVNLYGLILGFVLFTIVAVLFYSNKTIFSFFVLPLIFGFLSMGNAIAQSIYEWMYRAYGTDFLSIDTRFGDDYGK